MGTLAQQATEDITVHGRVVHLFYQSPRFTAGVLKCPAEGSVKFSGKFMVSAGDEVRLVGHWAEHPKYGRQFSAAGLQQDLPVDVEGLAHYLATNPAFHGIGPERARCIAETFGDQFDFAIREEPWRVAQAAHLKPAVLETLRREWLERAEVNTLSAWLGAFGLTHRQITTLVEHLGHNAKAILQDNPYELCWLLPGFGFGRVDEMAQKMGVEKEHPARIAAVFRHLLLKAEGDGHCWLEENVLLHDAVKALCLDTLNAQTVIYEHLAREIAAGNLYRHDGGAREVIALPGLAQREMGIIRTLLSARGTMEGDETDWEALLDEVAPDLHPSQRMAALTACRERLSLIAGAAGSGKSYTIAAIYRMFSRVCDDVVLAAPTGKAAKRLEQLCGTEAKTIHRLLEYNRVSWGRTRENPIDAEVVITDECSMADVHLMWHLLDAIDFSRTRLILVRAPNQLPPVGPGNILRDLLARQVIPTTVLDQVVRQAGTLKENCTAILRGEVRETADGTNGLLRPWYRIADCREDDMVLATLEQIMREVIPRLGLDPVRDVQVLTPMNKGPLGTRALNILLQRLIQEQVFGVRVPPVPDHRRPVFYLGDKVMQTKNNYDLELMNGAIGTIRDIVAEEEKPGQFVDMLVLEVEGREIRLPRQSEAADDLMLAYAATVHKSQGSEFPVVITIVHREHTFMLNRNLLYTAVTRARQSAILLGDRVGMTRAVGKRDVDRRKTFLGLVDLEAFSPGGAA